MSDSHPLNRRVHKSMNPKKYIPGSSISNYPTHDEFGASKIQRLVKNRDIRRSAKKMKETIKNQAYRCGLIKHLSKFINTNTCELLLLGSEGPEIFKTQYQSVTMRALLIVLYFFLLPTHNIESNLFLSR